jgi:hypothetical protein
MPEAHSESNKKTLVHTFSPLFKEKNLLIHKNCINKFNLKFSCASIIKKIIFYFCKSMEFYLIKGWFF